MRLNDFIRHKCISDALFTPLLANAIPDNFANRQLLNGTLAQVDRASRRRNANWHFPLTQVTQVNDNTPTANFTAVAGQTTS